MSEYENERAVGAYPGKCPNCKHPTRTLYVRTRKSNGKESRIWRCDNLPGDHFGTPD
ncbi:hypothetical protein TSOC111612_01400 [Tsukamurella ocularis]